MTIQIPIFALSSQGLNRSTLGSAFEFKFETPLRIPSNTMPTVSLYSASVWYNTPNLSNELDNNKLVVSFSNVNEGDQRILIFSKGLYSLQSVNAALNAKLIEISGFGGSEIILVANNSEQRLYIRCSPSTASGDITIHFESEASTIKEFLGFIGTDTPFETNGSVNNILGDSTAKFNSLSYYVISCSLSQGAYAPNGSFNNSQLAAVIPQSVTPGSLIVYNPVNTIRCQSNLAGATVSRCVFTLTDQNGDPIDCIGEEWSAQIVVEY